MYLQVNDLTVLLLELLLQLSRLILCGLGGLCSLALLGRSVRVPSDGGRNSYPRRGGLLSDGLELRASSLSRGAED